MKTSIMTVLVSTKIMESLKVMMNAINLCVAKTLLSGDIST